MGTSDLVGHYFDKAAAQYSLRSARGWWSHLREREWRAIVPLLKPSRGEKLLELGCGAGFYSSRLKSQFGVEPLGVDVSSEMAKQAALNGVSTWCGRAENIDHISTASFDLVLAAGLLEFISDPQRTLVQAARVLRPSGRLVLLIPRAGALGYAYDWVHHWQGCPAWTRPSDFYVKHLRSLGLSYLSHRMPTPISMAMSFRKDGHGPA